MIRGVARRDGEKRDEATRRADRRQDTFRTDERTARIGRNKNRRRLARSISTDAGIPQINLASWRRILDEIGGVRAKSDVTAVGAHRRRVAVAGSGDGIAGGGKQRGMRLAVCWRAFTRIAQKDLSVLVLHGGISHVASVKTDGGGFLGDGGRRIDVCLRLGGRRTRP